MAQTLAVEDLILRTAQARASLSATTRLTTTPAGAPPGRP